MAGPTVDMSLSVFRLINNESIAVNSKDLEAIGSEGLESCAKTFWSNEADSVRDRGGDISE